MGVVALDDLRRVAHLDRDLQRVPAGLDEEGGEGVAERGGGGAGGGGGRVEAAGSPVAVVGVAEDVAVRAWEEEVVRPGRRRDSPPGRDVLGNRREEADGSDAVGLGRLHAAVVAAVLDEHGALADRVPTEREGFAGA